MITNNRIIVASLLSWLLFIPGAKWAPLLYFLDFVNALGFTFGLAVIWRYAPGAFWSYWMVLRGIPNKRSSMLVLGIVKTWVAMVGRSVLIWRWRWLGEPAGGLDNMGMAAVAWLIIVGGACHLAASTMETDDVEIPVLTAKLTWGSVASGTLLGAIIAYQRAAQALI